MNDYNVLPKGYGFSGFIGVNHQFLGIEAIYSQFNTKAAIKHEGREYQLSDKTSATGLALRLSTSVFNIRAGLVQYDLKYSSDAAGPAAGEIDDLYELNKNDKKMGSLLGIGLHWEITDGSRFFTDFSNYAINGVGHYQTLSIGVVILFKGDLKALSFSKDGM